MCVWLLTLTFFYYSSCQTIGTTAAEQPRIFIGWCVLQRNKCVFIYKGRTLAIHKIDSSAPRCWFVNSPFLSTVSYAYHNTARYLTGTISLSENFWAVLLLFIMFNYNFQAWQYSQCSTVSWTLLLKQVKVYVNFEPLCTLAIVSFTVCLCFSLKPIQSSIIFCRNWLHLNSSFGTFWSLLATDLSLTFT